jgi:hypothetical protein
MALSKTWVENGDEWAHGRSTGTDRGTPMRPSAGGGRAGLDLVPLICTTLEDIVVWFLGKKARIGIALMSAVRACQLVQFLWSRQAEGNRQFQTAHRKSGKKMRNSCHGAPGRVSDVYDGILATLRKDRRDQTKSECWNEQIDPRQ